MDAAAISEATSEPQIVFRGKKRKMYRQRAEPIGADDDEATTKSTEAPSSESAATTFNAPATLEVTTPNQSESAVAEEEEEKGLSVAEVLRLRNARKSRLGGVKFGAGNTHSSGDAGTSFEGGEGLDELTLMIREEEGKAMDIAAGVKQRFAAQTGLATELVNKHMEEYIEAELARRHNATAISSSSSRQAGAGTAQGHSPNQESRFTEIAGIIPKVTAPRIEQRNRALQGQLMEIDLGDEARSRNEALTERARRRLQGEAVEDEEQQNARPTKVRLGKDGKPWRPRNRRTSDDIKRDKLVEEILRENRLDVYEAPAPPTQSLASGSAKNGPDGTASGAAADDRIAEEFRREFMDAMAERQKKRKKPSNAPPAPPGGKGGAAGGAKDEDILRGPKLGGSRNVRAAMRNILLEKAKEAKKAR